MVKSVFKEIIIILLLIAVIVLLLSILLYKYTPNSKTIPSKVEEYALEDTIKQELNKELSSINSEEIIKTYNLDDTDMYNYEKTNQYNKGKINPFAVYNASTNNSTSNNTNNNTNNVNNNTSNDPTKDNFINHTGK